MKKPPNLGFFQVESPTQLAVELVAESPVGAESPRCVRAGCDNAPVASGDWDEEYCSSECVVRHCRCVRFWAEIPPFRATPKNGYFHPFAPEKNAVLRLFSRPQRRLPRLARRPQRRQQRGFRKMISPPHRILGIPPPQKKNIGVSPPKIPKSPPKFGC